MLAVGRWCTLVSSHDQGSIFVGRHNTQQLLSHETLEFSTTFGERVGDCGMCNILFSAIFRTDSGSLKTIHSWQSNVRCN